jgi:hypothetical protein
VATADAVKVVGTGAGEKLWARRVSEVEALGFDGAGRLAVVAQSEVAVLTAASRVALGPFEDTPLALAWSPDGTRLAVRGSSVLAFFEAPAVPPLAGAQRAGDAAAADEPGPAEPLPPAAGEDDAVAVEEPTPPEDPPPGPPLDGPIAALFGAWSESLGTRDWAAHEALYAPDFQRVEGKGRKARTLTRADHVAARRAALDEEKVLRTDRATATTAAGEGGGMDLRFREWWRRGTRAGLRQRTLHLRADPGGLVITADTTEDAGSWPGKLRVTAAGCVHRSEYCVDEEDPTECEETLGEDDNSLQFARELRCYVTIHNRNGTPVTPILHAYAEHSERGVRRTDLAGETRAPLPLAPGATAQLWIPRVSLAAFEADRRGRGGHLVLVVTSDGPTGDFQRKVFKDVAATYPE